MPQASQAPDVPTAIDLILEAHDATIQIHSHNWCKSALSINTRVVLGNVAWTGV